MFAAPGNLHLIAARSTLFEPPRGRLDRFIHSALSYYDFVLVDGSAGIGRSTEIAGSVCSGALIVSACDPITVRDGAKVSDSLRGLPRRMILNRFLRRQLCGDLADIDALIDRVGVQLISVVPEDPAVPYFCSTGLALPRESPAAQEIEDLQAVFWRIRTFAGKPPRLTVLDP